MSKVYSFRLSDDNPREAQAREVIEAWVEEGYSFRYVIVEALLSNHYGKARITEGYTIIDQLKELILSLEKKTTSQIQEKLLPNTFLDSVKQSAKPGFSKK